MLFRLQCSADRQGQLHEVQSALVVYEDIDSPRGGLVSDLALKGMRRLSQEVFALFRKTFVEPGRNFLAEIDQTPDSAFFGDTAVLFKERDLSLRSAGQVPLVDRLAAARSSVKAFVLYQLGNRQPPAGSGVGCGLYDEAGAGDAGGIAKLMNDYVFDVCFDPDAGEQNVLHFADYCLMHLSSGFFSGTEEDGYVPTKTELPGGLDPLEMHKYWQRRRELILSRDLPSADRRVVTGNYVATYREDLPKVFAVLDQLSNDPPRASEVAVSGE